MARHIRWASAYGISRWSSHRNDFVAYIRDVLKGSGWTVALTEACVAPSGEADSFLRATHLTRTRHANQVTLLTLHNLQKDAFMLNELPKYFESATAWRNNMQKRRSTYMYWNLVMKYEILILIFIRAHSKKSYCALKAWMNARRCSLTWIMLMTRGGCLFTSRTWTSCPKVSRMSLRSLLTGSFRRPINKFFAIPFDQGYE